MDGRDLNSFEVSGCNLLKFSTNALDFYQNDVGSEFLTKNSEVKYQSLIFCDIDEKN